MGRAEETRKLIIKKAAPIFNKYGYKGTSMSQLTQAINMTKGAIYGNFKDKDEIAVAAFQYNFSKVTKAVARVTRPHENSCDKIIAFANFFLDSFSELSKGGGCPILNAAVDSDDVHPQLREEVKKALQTWMNSVSSMVYRGVRKGEVSLHVRPEQFASIFVSLIEGGVMMSKVTGNSIYLSRNIDHIIHLVNSELRA